MNVAASVKTVVSSFIVGFTSIIGANTALGDLNLTVLQMALFAGGFAALTAIAELISPTAFLRPVLDGTLTGKLSGKPGA